MGRNSIPKLGEWRDGKLYRFTQLKKSASDPDECLVPTDPNSGRMVSYECVSAPLGYEQTEILACCWQDGYHEVMASMYHSGHSNGYKLGFEEALRSVRASLGIKED